MNRDELLRQWKKDADTQQSLAQLDVLLKSLCDVAAAELLGGGEVALPGLGKLKVRETAAREAHNPRTGEVLHVPAGRKVVFVSGKDLKEALKA